MTDHYANLRDCNKKYQLIFADPPWAFNNKRTGGSMKSGAEQHYNTAEMHELCGIPVEDIADDNCVLLMWWVASMPKEALYLIEDWGFELKTMTAFVWDKLSSTGNKRHFGMGHWTRAGSECVLLATRGKPSRASAGVRSVISAPNTRHSKKPDIFYNEAVRLCGDVPRIELFARDIKTGWDAFGDEIGD